MIRIGLGLLILLFYACSLPATLTNPDFEPKIARNLVAAYTVMFALPGLLFVYFGTRARKRVRTKQLRRTTASDAKARETQSRDLPAKQARVISCVVCDQGNPGIDRIKCDRCKNYYCHRCEVTHAPDAQSAYSSGASEYYLERRCPQCGYVRKSGWYSLE